MKGALIRLIMYASFFFVGVALSKIVAYQESAPIVREDGAEYFKGCVDGLMTAAVLSGVPTAMEAHQSNVVRICNEAYTRRYNDSSYNWVTEP